MVGEINYIKPMNIVLAWRELGFQESSLLSVLDPQTTSMYTLYLSFLKTMYE